MLYCPCGLCAVGAFSSVFSSQGVRGNIEALVDSVLAPYQITRGTLPSVAMRKGASGVLVSDIAVGSLVIGEETTVADLACAVVAMNADWEKGDQITFFYGDLNLQAIFAADAPQGGGGNDDDNDDDNPWRRWR